MYPPKGTEGGPIVFTYVLSPEGTLQSRPQWGPFPFFPFCCGLRRVFDTFNLLAETCHTKKKTENVLFDGMDGWIDFDTLDPPLGHPYI